MHTNLSSNTLFCQWNFIGEKLGFFSRGNMENVQARVVFLCQFYRGTRAQVTCLFTTNHWVHRHRDIFTVLLLSLLQVRSDGLLVFTMGDQLVVQLKVPSRVFCWSTSIFPVENP